MKTQETHREATTFLEDPTLARVLEQAEILIRQTVTDRLSGIKMTNVDMRIHVVETYSAGRSNE